MITFNCTKCNHSYRVPDDYAGKRVRCKQCQTVNEIPQAQTKTGSDDSVAAFNQLLQELSQYEKTAPELDPNATGTPS